VHGLGNKGKEGKQQAHLYNVPKILLLAFNLSRMHTKVDPNILRRFSVRKWKVPFIRIFNHSN